MSFLYPNFLWALLFIAVPIIIHLFYFRRYKKVLFSNVSFLNEIKDERATKNKLKHLLVLLSRILAIIFLVLAFAQPYFATKTNKQSIHKNISIYIDNSFSMNAETDGLLMLDKAKDLGQNIINTYAENDASDAYKYQILTNDFEGKHQRLVGKTEALALIKEIKTSPSWQSYSSIYDRQKAVFKNANEDNEIYQVSDYQRNNTLFDADTNFTTSLVQLSSVEIRNIYIDSIWFQNSFQLKDASNQLLVRFVNESSEDVSGNYQFVLANEVKAVGTYTIPKNSSFIDTVTFKISDLAWNTGKIQLSDYPITFDDTYFFSFYVEEKVNVLSISETENDAIFNAVFKSIENISFENVVYTKVDYNQLQNQLFIILNGIKTIPTGLAESLKKYVENGGNIFIVPNEDASLVSYNTLLSGLNVGTFAGQNIEQRSVSNLNLNHYVVNDLFINTPKDIQLPVSKKQYILKTKNSSNEQQIMSFRNNEAFLASYSFNNGNIYLTTSALAASSSDLASNALFAPMVYKMAVMSVNNNNLSFEINANTKVVINKNLASKNFQLEDIIKVKNADKNLADLEFIPQKNRFGGALNLSIYQNNLDAGIYKVINQKQNGGEQEEIAQIALNYNRKESVLKYFNLKELENHFDGTNVNVISGNLSSVKENIVNIKDGNHLWKWFIIFSLLFLAFEIILLRILK